MPASWKASIAGFIGSLVLAVFFYVFNSTGVLQQLDVVALINRLGSIGRGAAWVDHFIVGTLLWGPMFAAYDATTNQWPRWQKGLAFSGFAWLGMMFIFMPVIGAGLFGLGSGLVTPIGMLVLHLIYGIVLGVTYQVLDEKFPTKPPVPDMEQRFGQRQ